MRRRRRCWRQQLSSSLSAMLHGFSSRTWLSKPPQMTLQPLSLPSTSRFSTRSWYLSEQLVLLALADDDLEQELKSKILERLLDSEVPDQFSMGKPELPVILMSTELSELVGPQSWFLVKVADVPKEELEKWKRGEATQSFDTFKNFVKKIACVNDCAERNIRLIQDFIGGYKSEDMKQNLMLVARDNRKKLKKELSKTQLKDV